MNADFWTAVAAVAASLSALVAIIAVFPVLGQLRKMAEAGELMAESNRLANAMAVVTIEEAVRSARGEYADAASKIVHSDEKTPGAPLDAATLAFEEKLERYLNVMDRLCSYVRRGLIDETLYKQDYREWIAETIDQYPDKFQANTRHVNILKVHEAWREERPARSVKAA